MKKVTILLILLISIIIYSDAQQKILFDNTKNEQAGNADWIPDANSQIPSPAQSGISGNPLPTTSGTAENYWSGALSAWAVDMAKRGYTIETLPSSGNITYGNGSNPQDLSNYIVFVVCEPNNPFSASEKTAILNFVNAGGGLFMIADHPIADRDGDGWAAVDVWDDLMTGDPFGMTFSLTDDQTNAPTTNLPTLPGDPLLHGVAGDVGGIEFHGGATMSINTGNNPSVKAVVFKTGASTSGSTGVVCAYATYGSGRIVGLGDSSIPEDDTPNGGTTYPGWFQPIGGSYDGHNGRLVANATIWLMGSAPAGPTLSSTPTSLTGLDYVVGSGPSTSQTISVSGSNLDGTQATITAPANFEVSLDNTTFYTSVNISYTAPTLNGTTVYVRLQSGLAVNSYSGNVVLSDDGTASDVNIAVSGNVNPVGGGANIIISEFADASAYLASFIEIYNAGNAAQDLTGWTLSENGSVTTTIGSITLQPCQYLVLIRGALSDLTGLYGTWQGDYYIENAGFICNGGDYFELKDNSSVLIDNAGSSSSTSASNSAYERMDANSDGTIISTMWNKMANRDNATPGTTNTYAMANAGSCNSPTLSVSPSTLSGFTYVVGNGPSTSQTYNLAGSNLDATDITIGAPTHYEISLDNTTFSTSLTITTAHANYDGTTLTATAIYIRLKAGFAVNTYNNEIVTNTGGGVTTSVDVTNNGEVTADATVTLADNGTQIAAADVAQGTVQHVLHTFTLDVANTSTTLNQVDFTSAGTYAATDVTKFQLWYSTTNDISGATQVGSDITTSLGTGTHSFTILSQALAVNTYYFWITTDIDAAATVNNTINANAIATTGLTFANGTKSGSTTAGSAQTIIAYTAPSVFISEIASKGNNGNYQDEYIEISNNGGSGADLTGWHVEYYNSSDTKEGDVTLSGILASDDAWIIAARTSGYISITPDYNGNFPMNSSCYVKLVDNSSTIIDEAGTSTSDEFADAINYEFTDCSNDNLPTANWDNLGTGNGTPGVVNCNTSPSVIVSTSSLTGFTYVVGNGGSPEQSFTAEGTNLTADISIVPPTNYEISTGTGGSFVPTNPITLTQSGGTVSTTTIYVRLKAGLSIGTYNSENITASSTGATDQTVTCDGNVTGNNASDIVIKSTFSEPINIPYINYQSTNIINDVNDIEVAQFTIQDGGITADADNLSTELTDIVFSLTNSTDIRRVAIYDGATEIAEVAGGATLTFNGISLTAPDNGSKTFSIRVSFNSTVTDNDQFQLTVTSATAATTGSTFAAADAGGAQSTIVGDENRIEVTAMAFNYTSVPVTVSVNSDFIVEVEAVDANGNRDLGYTSSVTLSKNTGSGIISSVTGLTQSFVSGTYQWTDVQMDTQGVFSVLVSDGILPDKVSSDINAIQLIVFQGFDSAPRDNWTYSGGGAVSSNDVTTNSGTIIHPYNGIGDNTSNDGKSWKMQNGNVLTTDNVDLTNYTNVEFSFLYAGQDVNSGGEINLDVSYDGGTTWLNVEPYTDAGMYPEGGTFIADGYSGADWDFGSTNNPSTGAFYPDNPFMMSIDDSKTQFMARIMTGQYYYFDEIQLTGTYMPLIITTLNFMGATQTSVKVNAFLEFHGGKTVTERGIVLGTSSNPTTGDTKIANSGTGLGYYTANFTGLTANTTYYTRAYVITNESGTVYGNELSFTTCDGTGECQNNTDLIISEYIESSCGGTNNAIEIFNGTGSTVNLKHYRIWHDNGGSYETYTDAYDFLDYDLPNNQTFVIANAGSTAPEFDLKTNGGQADVQNSVASLSGDEQIQLLKTTDNFQNYDVIEHVGGQYNWGEVKTFARNPDITDPKTRTIIGDNTCDPNINGEWILYPDCYYDDLGSHRVDFDWEGDVNSDWFEINNWDLNRTPTRSSTVVIPDVVTAGTGVFPKISDNATGRIAEAYKLNIETGAVVTIGTNGLMTVTGLINNSNGASGLLIKSGADSTGSLIIESGSTAATCERYLSGGSNVWHSIFSPLSAADLPTGYAYSYDETIKDIWNTTTNFGWDGSQFVANQNLGWKYVTGIFSTSGGYLLNSTADQTAILTGGNLETGDKSFNVSKTINSGTIPTSGNDPNGISYSGCVNNWNEYDGWVFVGNPYASAIDWSTAYAGDDDIEGGIYIWDNTTDNYKYFLDSDGSNSSFSVGITVNGDANTKYIPSGQGFFVKATGTGTDNSFTIPASARTHTTHAFWKGVNEKIQNLLRLNITKDNFTDETVLFSVNGATDDFDGSFDLHKRFSINSSVPQIYSVNKQGARFALNSFPEIKGHKIVPLGIYIGVSGEYSIDITENNFKNVHIWLEDRNRGTFTNLNELTTYVFNQTVEINNDRFFVHFERNTAPFINSIIPDQTTPVNESYTYTLPNNVFADKDFKDVLTINVSTEDGNQLPKWLSFNDETLSFSGIPKEIQTVNIKLTATDIFGASVSDVYKLSVTSTSGISEINNENVRIYPNPAKGFFVIEFNKPVNAKVSINDISGKQIFLKKMTSNRMEVNMNSYSKGIYIIKIDTGSNFINRRIIIQ